MVKGKVTQKIGYEQLKMKEKKCIFFKDSCFKQ